MINGKSVLAVIPARGGSKGIPRKNIKIVAGKPLIAWTIEEAKKSRYIDRIIITSEDEEIIGVAEEWGCEAPFVRPAELAQDATPGIEPVLHALNVLPEKYDYVVLLQPTSPLRSVNDIDGCIKTCAEKKANACVSVTEPSKSPFWMYTLDEHNHMHKLIDTDQVHMCRQQLPQVFVLNGAVYVAKSDWLRINKMFLSDETVGFVMPHERSTDIDTIYDMFLAEQLLAGLG